MCQMLSTGDVLASRFQEWEGGTGRGGEAPLWPSTLSFFSNWVDQATLPVPMSMVPTWHNCFLIFYSASRFATLGKFLSP